MNWAAAAAGIDFSGQPDRENDKTFLGFRAFVSFVSG
jgi:hypothetical protein